MARPALLRAPPATERGLRTRATLVAAARKVFEQFWYLDARLIDITRSANCSAGTFYTYFSYNRGTGSLGAAGDDRSPALQRTHASARKIGQHRVVIHCVESSVSQENRS
jgi:hypothetical protein